ncbi:MAG: hypothetical protein MUO62_19850, partial [Anaerolineales bacterium]|nr:hypothetical protein [Anaerolineales bacterium]
MTKFRTAEHMRLADSETRKADWKNWGTYLSERAWCTVREDYSATGEAWEYFPHDHARSRAFRWNEDGLGGFCNRFQNICLGVALWNEQDPILKERLPIWAPIFASMLVKRAFETQGIVENCDMVMSASNKYRQGQDHIAAFVAE